MSQDNIPSVVHYFWFGGAAKPESVVKCINSWKKYLPTFEIKEWNESNFNVEQCNFSKEAYELKKWAFVADYARMKVLYQYGGLYFDTDVEIIKEIEDILANGSFMAFETENSLSPGLGLYARSELPIYKEIIDYYEKIKFERSVRCDQYVIGNIVTNVMLKHGLQLKQEIQKVDGIMVYPIEYFCPIDFSTGIMNITQNTRTIHHYDATWFTKKELKWHKLEAYIGRKLGACKIKKIKAFVIWRGIAYVYKYGCLSALRRIFKNYTVNSCDM